MSFLLRPVRTALCATMFIALMSANCSTQASSTDWWDAFQRGDYQTALPTIRAKAKQGNMDAQFALAQLYDAGIAVEQDKARAAELYRQSAQQGHLSAQHLIGLAELYGLGIERAPTSGARWIHRAAERGHGGAQWTLGSIYSRGGLLYGISGGEYPRDGEQALHWYRKAAVQGSAFIQSRLAFKLMLGDRIPEDDAEGAQWYERSARGGYVGAQAQMGALYARGEGVEKDLIRAYAWNQVAIRNGQWAKDSTLTPFQEGLTNEQIDELGAAQGYRTAMKLKSELEKKLMPAQRVEAERLTQELLAGIPARK